jgi:ABC-2 type transport system ATP-binding protein
MLFELDNVQKYYGRFEAIGGLTLRVDSQAVGLLGPNGAGKSTLIKTLLGLLELTSGSAVVLGHRLPGEARQIRRLIGYMPENDCYLPYMTAIEYVAFNGQLCGMPRAEAFRRAHEVLYYVGLGEARYRKLQGFSTGMKQRAKLAQALVHGPKLIFLDEPTNGLDPKGRDEMLQLVEDVKRRGVAIVLSTHLLPDVERVCDSVILLNQGQLVHYGTIAALKDDGRRIIELETKDANERFEKLLAKQGIDVEREGLRLKVLLKPGQDEDALLRIAVDADIELRHFMPAELTLETAFLSLLDHHQAAQREPAVAEAAP